LAGYLHFFTWYTVIWDNGRSTVLSNAYRWTNNEHINRYIKLNKIDGDHYDIVEYKCKKEWVNPVIWGDNDYSIRTPMYGIIKITNNNFTSKINEISGYMLDIKFKSLRTGQIHMVWFLKDITLK